MVNGLRVAPPPAPPTTGLVCARVRSPTNVELVPPLKRVPELIGPSQMMSAVVSAAYAAPPMSLHIASASEPLPPPQFTGVVNPTPATAGSWCGPAQSQQPTVPSRRTSEPLSCHGSGSASCR